MCAFMCVGGVGVDEWVGLCIVVICVCVSPVRVPVCSVLEC